MSLLDVLQPRNIEIDTSKARIAIDHQMKVDEEVIKVVKAKTLKTITKKEIISKELRYTNRCLTDTKRAINQAKVASIVALENKIAPLKERLGQLIETKVRLMKELETVDTTNDLEIDP
jgi:hypothetical protein